ncbi:MAG: hypothetical protein VB108_02460 [Anaerolineaceae bacterium]|nr:hypothetical protein [Anaerolineaceae bacterium]
METEKRSNLYLLTGLIFGLAIGLVISLMIVPAINRDAAPAHLSAQSKNEYRLMIAKTFASDYNLARAQSRLALLQEPSTSVALSEQIQSQPSGSPKEDDEVLKILMDALGAANAPAPLESPTP